MVPPPVFDVDVRMAALRAGLGLGWLSVTAVLVGLALGLPADHVPVLLGLTAAAGLANGALAAAPGSWWTASRRGQHLLELWSAGLLALTSALVLVAGARSGFDLLLFLVLPFLAAVHTGRARLAWLVAALGTYLTVMAVAPAPISAGSVALRVCLLLGASILALALAELTRRTADARAALSARAELEHALLAEAHHRVTNSLQTVADLLLLGRPAGESGRAFDETAGRIRAIALVHRLLAGGRGADVDGRVLLERITESLTSDARVEAVAVGLAPACAQHLGVVANELIANAVQHGRPPIEVRLVRDDQLVLVVCDGGLGKAGGAEGLGLQLVERIVAQGLRGSFEIGRDARGRTEARVTFDDAGTCES
ncbi:MAG: hypothetical protein NVSMB25_12170 [Thermoleophilaceae bacterium]